MTNSSPAANLSVSVNLLHHGAAAASQREVVAWIPPVHNPETALPDSNSTTSLLVYASHSILNVCHADRVSLAGTDVDEPIWHVKETLCTQSAPKGSDASKHVITCLKSLSETISEHTSSSFSAGIVSGYADGSLTVWFRYQHSSAEWCEQEIIWGEGKLPITSVDAVWVETESTLLIMVGTSAGATLLECVVTRTMNDDGTSFFDCKLVQSTPLLEDMAVSSLLFRLDTQLQQIWALIGTAAPRHNKIHVLHSSNRRTEDHFHFHYSGSLNGHEDWITCMAWTNEQDDDGDENMTHRPLLLATGSQDMRIRLWKFTTTTNNNMISDLPTEPELVPNHDDDEISEDDDNSIAHEEEEEGESRLDIQHQKTLTRVTLEALLMGHEEGITSICWYRQSKAFYNQEHLLVSSSMDRSILLWTPGEDGIWTPLTRVGSAGGILGGSVGSSLLGYLSVVLEPTLGTCMVGHAYGGSLHVWNVEGVTQTSDQQDMPTDERASYVYWKATPCVTGHFGGVVDLCWEASSGMYLLTASEDQTCRLWACSHSSITKEPIWLEVARPQVHGYNLAAITSLSCARHPHFLVSGADEKELRSFHATQLTLRTLENFTGKKWSGDDVMNRVERAYIPSLGLSNKASAADGAEEDVLDESANDQSRSNVKLPLERDLGVASLWPEANKLFGHTTELYCLTSTLESNDSANKGPVDILVASSCKARDEETAAIRLWNALEGKSYQVLSGGHKSTVASLAFSPDSSFLASSGKDRRLCLWQRGEDGQYALAWAKDSAHKRIVWSVHFLPWGEKRILASGSRDGSIKIWNVASDNDGVEASMMFDFAPLSRVKGKADSVTALSFCPAPMSDGTTALLAVGLETGNIELWSVPLDGTDSPPSLNLALPPNVCHKATITKLSWRSSKAQETANVFTLASCSMDNGCRLFSVKTQ